MDDADDRKRTSEAWTHKVNAFVAFVMLLGVLWFDSQFKPDIPVAEPFTRVGGETRVDVALEASHFWPQSSGFVTARAPANNRHLFYRARCGIQAVSGPLPLLLNPPEDRGPRPRKVAQRKAALGSNVLRNEPCAPATDIPCPPDDTQGSAWNVFDPLGPSPSPTLPKWVPTCARIFDFVILVAGQSDRRAPDVAIAMTLAARLAHEAGHPQQVTVVVVPRHLAADPALADALRDRDDTVTGGIVLGQVTRITPETRETVRALLTVPPSASWWERFKQALSQLAPLIAAILGLWALTHGAQVAKPALTALYIFVRHHPAWPGLSPRYHPPDISHDRTAGGESTMSNSTPTTPAQGVVPTEKLGLLKWPTPASDLKDSSGSAVAVPLSDLLQALQLLATDTDRQDAAAAVRWDAETPGSMQVIKSGSLQITKTGIKLVTRAGGTTAFLSAAAGVISAFRDDVGEPITVTLLGGAALIISSVAIALALFVKGDLEARGTATAARHQGRAEVAAAFLGATGGMPSRGVAIQPNGKRELLADFFVALNSDLGQVTVTTRNSSEPSRVTRLSRTGPEGTLRILLESGDEIELDEITGFSTTTKPSML